MIIHGKRIFLRNLDIPKQWIPAFAGMTEKGGNDKKNAQE
jgi:hypothetical protein